MTFPDENNADKTINATSQDIFTKVFNKYGPYVLYQVEYNADGLATNAKPVLQDEGSDGSATLTDGTTGTINHRSDAALVGVNAAKYLGRDAYVTGETIHDPYDNSKQDVYALWSANPNADKQDVFNDVSGAIVYGGTLEDITSPGYGITVVYNAATYYSSRSVKYVYINKLGADPDDMASAELVLTDYNAVKSNLASQTVDQLTALQTRLNNVSEAGIDSLTAAEQALLTAAKTAVAAAIAAKGATASTEPVFVAFAGKDGEHLLYWVEDAAAAHAPSTLTTAQREALLHAAGVGSLNRTVATGTWTYTYGNPASTKSITDDVIDAGSTWKEVNKVSINGTTCYVDGSAIYASDGTVLTDAQVEALVKPTGALGTGVEQTVINASKYVAYSSYRTVANVVNDTKTGTTAGDTVVTNGWIKIDAQNTAMDDTELEKLGTGSVTDYTYTSNSAALKGSDANSYFKAADGLTIKIEYPTFSAKSATITPTLKKTGGTISEAVVTGQTMDADHKTLTFTVDTSAVKDEITGVESTPSAQVYNVVVKTTGITNNEVSGLTVSVGAPDKTTFAASNTDGTITVLVTMSGKARTASGESGSKVTFTLSTNNGGTSEAWAATTATGASVSGTKLSLVHNTADYSETAAQFTATFTTVKASVDDGTITLTIAAADEAA